MTRHAISDLPAFLAVAQERSFTRAAAKLGVSQSALSHNVRALETRLGVRLLTRTTRSVRVTDAGARYVEDCRRIIAELSEADESVGGSHGAPRGCLTLTAPVLFGSKFVTPIVAEYLQTYPQVSASCLFLDSLTRGTPSAFPDAVTGRTNVLAHIELDETPPTHLRLDQIGSL